MWWAERRWNLDPGVCQVYVGCITLALRPPKFWPVRFGGQHAHACAVGGSLGPPLLTRLCLVYVYMSTRQYLCLYVYETMSVPVS